MKKSEFISEWNQITLMKIFEVPVTDRRTGESDYIIFDISIRGRSFVAHHEPLSAKQARSKKISFVRVPIDFDFSIDSNLQYLYEECINAIINSEYFTY